MVDPRIRTHTFKIGRLQYLLTAFACLSCHHSYWASLPSELLLDIMGEGDEVGIEEGGEVCRGAEDGASLVSEDILDFATDERGDGGIVGHCMVIRIKWGCL